MTEKKYIRFINGDYQTLFHIPDGGRIRITYPDREPAERVCRFIDEYHAEVGNCVYHICEFAERMEQIGAKYEPLDYIREPEFYPKYYLAASENGSGSAYRIIDTRQKYGFAFAPKGAARGQKYCIFRQHVDGNGHFRVSCIVQWSDNLKDIAPQDWGFDMKKIKAVTQRPKKRPGHRR